MNLLNLTEKSNSDIKYHISNYPDGQLNVELELAEIFHSNRVMIESRMSSYKDLMIILAANDILRHEGFSTVELYCPYILGSRSDRRFKDYQSFDLKITADLINSCDFDRVFVCDQHSDVTSALIKRCVNIDAFQSWISLVDFVWKEKIIVSPDAGAYKKIFGLADKLGCGLLSGSKVRIPGGAPQVVIHGDVKDRDCVIIDDICDGGRTFIELGKLLKEMGAKSVTLFVTHGVFSRGIQLENINSIYTTNSYQSFDDTEQTDYFHITNIF